MAYLLQNSKYDYAQDLSAVIEKIVLDDDLTQVFIIVPTGKYVRYLEKEIVRSYFKRHGKPCGTLNIFTIQKFVQYCFNLLFPRSKYRMVSDAYRLALFEEATAKADLALFRSNRPKITGSLLQRLADVVYGLKEDGITVDSLKKDLGDAIKNKDESVDIHRLGDITKIYEQYQKLIKDNILDFPEQIKLTTSELKSKKDLRSIFPENIKVFVAGFSEFKQPETEFFSAFARSSIPFALNLEYSDTNGPLFGNLEDNILLLTKDGFVAHKTSDDLKLNSKDIQLSSFLKRWLFNKEMVVEKNPAFSNMTSIFSMANRIEEVKYLAKLVKYLHIKENIPLHRMCIVMRQTGKYTNLFREIFSQNLIPMNISDRYDLKTSPIATAVFAILDLITKGYHREDIHRATSNSYFTFKKDDGSEIDGYNIYNIALQFRIEGGKKSKGSKFWLNKLKDSIETIDQRIKNIDASKYEDEMEIVNLEIQLKSANKAYDDFLELITILPEYEYSITPAQFSSLIKDDILKKMKVKENILSFYNHIEHNKEKYSGIEYVQYLEKAEKDAQAYSAFIDIVDEMEFILNDLTGAKEIPFEDLVERLKTSVSAKKYQIREKNNHGINITAIEQTRGIPYDVMILCGAVDGEFPMRYNPETFLGKELKDTEIRHLKSEYMQFYQFLTNNEEKLNDGTQKIYITYPKEDNSQDLAPSSFINSLLEITTIREDNKIYNIADLLAKYKKDELSEMESLQIKDIPWIRSISNKSEKLRNYAAHMMNDPQSEEIEKHFSGDFIKSKNAIFVQHFINNFNKDIAMGHIDINDLPGNAQERLKEISQKPFSVSSLELYAKCPFQFFMKNIIKVPEKKEYDLILSPMDIGNILHNTVYKFYMELQNENKDAELHIQGKQKDLPQIKTVSLDPRMHNYYMEKINRIAKEEYSKYQFDNPFFHIQKSELFSTEKKTGLLKLFLKNEYDKYNKGWNFLPGLFEFSFGIYSRYSVKTNISHVELSDKLKIKGKIDRVEFFDSDEGRAVLIADYKTSFNNIPAKNQITEGKRFQIPLYLLSIRKILEDLYGIDIILSGGAYYSFKPEYNKNEYKYFKLSVVPKDNPLEINTSRQTLTKDQFLDDVLEQSITYAEEILNNISDGDFPVEPEDNKVCNYCNFKSICRISEQKFDFEEAEETTN